jgi:hypothetical protein
MKFILADERVTFRRLEIARKDELVEIKCFSEADFF